MSKQDLHRLLVSQKSNKSNFLKSQLFLALLCFWDFHLLSTAPGGVIASHHPRVSYFYKPTHPLYFSTFYPKFWNVDYNKPPPHRLFVHNASMYFNPFKSPDSSKKEQSSAEGGAGPSRIKTITPFIGARALSNMEKFFEDLQENLKILKSSYDEERNSGPDTPKEPVPQKLTQARTQAQLRTNDVPKMYTFGRGGQRWVNPAASFFRGKHRLHGERPV